MDQIYPLPDSAHGTSSCASQDFDFLNYWVDQSVEKEIQRGIKLQKLKQRPSLRKEKYDVINIGHTNIYSEKTCKCRSKSLANSKKKGRKNSPVRKNSPTNRKTTKKDPKERCPMRIAELSVPSKRHCIETWRNNYHVLSGIMIDRLRQHVLDLSPVVKIPDAIDCFKRHKTAEKRKRRDAKKKEKKTKRINNNDNDNSSAKTKKPTKAEECQYLCAIFGHKIAKELNKPKQVILNTELQNMSNLVSIEIDKLLSRGQKVNNIHVKNKIIHAEVAGKISIWIADILDETAYKILEDQLQDLEDEVGPVLDFIDDLVDKVVDVCEPEPEVIEVSSCSETYIVDTSTETSEEQEKQEEIIDSESIVDNLLVEIDLTPETEQFTENLDDFITNELDKIIKSFEEDILEGDKDDIFLDLDHTSKEKGTELENEAAMEHDMFVDANDSFEVPLEGPDQADIENLKDSFRVTKSIWTSDQTRDTVIDDPELLSEDVSMERVKFSDKTQGAVSELTPEHFDDDVIRATPNDNLLSDADETWPQKMTPPIVRPSESVSKSITSLGKILEAEERISVEDSNIKVLDKDAETKLQTKTKEVINDANNNINKIEDSTQLKHIEVGGKTVTKAQDTDNNKTGQTIQIIGNDGTTDTKEQGLGKDGTKPDKYTDKNGTIGTEEGKTSKGGAKQNDQDGTTITHMQEHEDVTKKNNEYIKDEKDLSEIHIGKIETIDINEKWVSKIDTEQIDKHIDKAGTIDVNEDSKEETKQIDKDIDKDGTTAVTKKPTNMYIDTTGTEDLKEGKTSKEETEQIDKYIDKDEKITKEHDIEKGKKQSDMYIDKTNTIDVKDDRISKEETEPIDKDIDKDGTAVTKNEEIEKGNKQTDNYTDNTGTIGVKEERISKEETEQIEKYIGKAEKDAKEQEIEDANKQTDITYIDKDDIKAYGIEQTDTYIDKDERIDINKEGTLTRRAEETYVEQNETVVGKDWTEETHEYLNQDGTTVIKKQESEDGTKQTDINIDKDRIGTKEQNIEAYEIGQTDLYIDQDKIIDINEVIGKDWTEETDKYLNQDGTTVKKEQQIEDGAKQTEMYLDKDGMDTIEQDIEAYGIKQTDLYIDKDEMIDVKAEGIDKDSTKETNKYFNQDGTTVIKEQQIEDGTKQTDMYLNKDGMDTIEQDIEAYGIKQTDLYIDKNEIIDIKAEGIDKDRTKETNKYLEQDGTRVIKEQEIEDATKLTDINIDKDGMDTKEQDIKTYDIEKIDLYIEKDGIKEGIDKDSTEQTDKYLDYDRITVTKEQESENGTKQSDMYIESDEKTDTKKQDIERYEKEPHDKYIGKDAQKIKEDLNKLDTDIGIRPSSTDSTFDHHIPTQTIAYEQELDKISEEQNSQVTPTFDKKLEDEATQVTPKDYKKIGKYKAPISALTLKSVAKDKNKVIKTAEKATNTSFSLIPRADKSTSVVSQSLADITKHFQDVKANMFSSLRVKPKMDYRVDRDSAPSWVAQTYAEPSDSPPYTSPPRQEKESNDKNIRLWCKDLENGFDNLELWNGWIESTVQSVKVMEMKKARICIDKSRDEFVRDWVHLKKNVDADVQTWSKLNASTQSKMKSFRKIYQNLRFQTPSKQKNCNCHT